MGRRDERRVLKSFGEIIEHSSMMIRSAMMYVLLSLFSNPSRSLRSLCSVCDSSVASDKAERAFPVGAVQMIFFPG